MPTEVHVRAYRPEDLDGCLAVFDSNVPRYFTAPEREDFAAFLRALPGPYVVLEKEGREIVGCGGYAVVPDERRADLCWGMVQGSLHGTGLGRLLARVRCERAIADPGVDRLVLRTSQKTTGFYERLGFRVVEVIAGGIAPGLDECVMHLDVAGRERVAV